MLVGLGALISHPCMCILSVVVSVRASYGRLISDGVLSGKSLRSVLRLGTNKGQYH